MVANQPIERPSSDDYIVNKLRSLERQIDELRRQTKFPFTVAHDDPIAGRVVDMEISAIGGDSTGATVQLYDGTGNLVVGSDASAGYGLRVPMLQPPMYCVIPGSGMISTTSATAYSVGQYAMYNSCFLALWSLRVSSAGTTAPTGATYIQIQDATTGWNWTSPTVSASDAIGAGDTITSCGPYSVQLPPSSMGNVITVTLYAWLTANAGGGNGCLVTPKLITGCGYDYAAASFAGTRSS